MSGLSFREWNVKLSQEWDQRLEWVMPLVVKGSIEFTSFGVAVHCRQSWKGATRQNPHLAVSQVLESDKAMT